MNQFSKPSFSSTFFNRIKSLFDCLINQDVQLIDSNNYKVPYLLNHDYDFNEDDQTNDESSETSDVPLLEVKRINGNKKIITKKNDHEMSKNSGNLKTNQQIAKLRSTVFKIDHKSNDRLFTKLSTKFTEWPIKSKEKYVDELMKIALKYIELEDYDRSETVLFEILDFYLDKFVNIAKAIETLTLLEQIYFKLNRYLEQIEVNKLILNISGSDEQIKKLSIDKIVNAYKKMNLEHKAQKFIDDYNKKTVKK